MARREPARESDRVEASGCHHGPVAACHAPPGQDNKHEQRRWLRRVWLALPLGLLSLASTTLFDADPWAAWLAIAAAVPVQFMAGWPFLAGAVQQARAFSANMDTLIALGTLTAFTYSTYELFAGGPLFFDTAALIIAFVVLGHYLEARASLPVLLHDKTITPGTLSSLTRTPRVDS